MDAFEKDKRARNLRDGYQETKGLKDGHCNRQACQKPLAEEAELSGRRYSMSDFETNYRGARLYYCADCAMKFNIADDRFKEPRRITVETVF